MPYVLEGPGEGARLERQSLHDNYDFRRELGGLDFQGQLKILDAGCGSGVLSRWLAREHSSVRVTGTDLSSPRIQGATEAAAGISNLEYVVGDLLALPFSESIFDTVLCRFVLHHLGVRAGKAIQELIRVLKPGGQFVIVDVDGLLLNLHPQSERIARVLGALQAREDIDLRMGRKLLGLLSTCGVEDLSWEVLPYRSSSAGMQEEATLMEDRFRAAAPLLEAVCGSTEQADLFVQDYLRTMRSTGACYFHDKIRLTGRKAQSLRGTQP